MYNFIKKVETFAFCCLIILFILPETNLKASEITNENISGSGTKENPYILTTANDLTLLETYPTSYFELGADIDLANATRNAISGFSGTLDGKGYSISNFSINCPNTNNIGFFSTLSSGKITNLTLENETVSGLTHTGCLIGRITGADVVIQNCHVINSTITSKGSYVGGLIGYISVNLTETISNCSVENLSLIADGIECRNIGGLIGSSMANITRCFVTGSITADTRNIGGLLGTSAERHTVSECYADVDILMNGTWNFTAGGLIGVNYSGTIINCFTLGSMHDTINDCYNIGGITGSFGTNYMSYVQNCYCAMNIDNDRFYSTGIAFSGTGQFEEITNCFYDRILFPHANHETQMGRHSIQMRQQSTFTNWDFENVWAIDEGTSYPYLRNVKKPADLTGPGSAENPYLISTPEDLIYVNYDLAAHYEVINDIDMTDYNWSRIGSRKNPFTGVINGNNYTISNLSDDFIYYSPKCTITDLTIEYFDGETEEY